MGLELALLLDLFFNLFDGLVVNFKDPAHPLAVHVLPPSRDILQEPLLDELLEGGHLVDLLRSLVHLLRCHGLLGLGRFLLLFHAVAGVESLKALSGELVFVVLLEQPDLFLDLAVDHRLVLVCFKLPNEFVILFHNLALLQAVLLQHSLDAPPLRERPGDGFALYSYCLSGVAVHSLLARMQFVAESHYGFVGEGSPARLHGLRQELVVALHLQGVVEVRDYREGLLRPSHR
mmetsp:Transcript_29789/g.45417  ORF Transcript_29789/g.45417 Transcript_29789/m.45417 type:complete len:233 (-) Transcript_29789:1289-1987(-)